LLKVCIAFSFIASTVVAADSGNAPSVSQDRSPASEPTTVTGRPILIDLRSHRVQGLDLGRISIEEVCDAVGRKNVKESFVSHPVGDTSFAEFPAYLVDFGGHMLLIDDSQGTRFVTIDDPAFRTSENLGVGSTYADFFLVYGRGRVEGYDGHEIRFNYNSVVKPVAFQLVFDSNNVAQVNNKTELSSLAKVRKIVLFQR
jgi:hypothetical protein